MFTHQFASIRLAPPASRPSFNLRRPQLASAITLAIAAALAPALHAQSRVEPVVVTASRAPEAADATLRDVSVVDGAAIRAAGIVDVVDALRLLPGIELSLVGPGATPSIFMRGAHSNQTLILIDGQRISSSFSGLSALQHINVEQIERIEVLRGPAASLYGADAVGGVIQIITRRDRKLSARIEGGEWRSRLLSVNAGIGDAGNGLTVTAAQSASDGYNAIVNPADYSYNPDRDGYRFNTVQVNGALTPVAGLKLTLSGFETRGRAQYDGDASYDDRIRSIVNSLSAGAEWQASQQWTSSLRAGSSSDKSVFDSTFPGNFRTRNDQVAWQNNLRLTPALGVLGAIETRRESVASSDALPVTTRRTTSFLLGGDWTADALRANATVRIDDSNQYGTRTTASAGLGFRLSPGLRLLANAGNSFKAPTFNDLYYPGYANPNLKPERGQNVDFGVQWSSGSTRLKAIAYQNNVRDLIQFECDANYNCAPQNVAKARLQGVTLSAATQLAGFTIDGSVDLADPKNTTLDKQLARRAREHAALRIGGDVLGFSTGVELLASGKRYDNAGNSRVLPGYSLINLHLSRVVLPGVRIGARVENLTDRDYQLAYGYATGGRRAWLTLAVER